jgi:Family of unknown function (DUF5681)
MYNAYFSRENPAARASPHEETAVRDSRAKSRMSGASGSWRRTCSEIGTPRRAVGLFGWLWQTAEAQPVQTGQSGNPKGRPKAAKGLNTIVREAMTQRGPVGTGSGEKKMISRMEAVFLKTLELAMKGDPRAPSQLMTLYAAAVPEAEMPRAQAVIDDLSAADLAIFEAFKLSPAEGASVMIDLPRP